MKSLKVALLLAASGLALPGAASAQYWQDRDDYSYPLPAAAVNSDWAVQQRVQNRLERTLGRRAAGISVYVRRGVVTLSGRVRTHRELQLARSLAQDVGGVRMVRSRDLYTTAYRDRNW